MYYNHLFIEKKLSNVDMKIKDIMPRDFVIIVIINTGEPKNLGTARMKNSMREGCAKIVI